jgi:hypothetical protein
VEISLEKPKTPPRQWKLASVFRAAMALRKDGEYEILSIWLLIWYFGCPTEVVSQICDMVRRVVGRRGAHMYHHL